MAFITICCITKFTKCSLYISLDNKFSIMLQYYYKARNLALHKTHPELFDDVTTQVIC